MISSDLEACYICPRNCGVNRYHEKGYCRAGAELELNLAQLHFGEEPPISGSAGSGTIFFSHCNLRCVYCQNSYISLDGHGTKISEERLLEIMLELQTLGAHNINLVTPTHFSIQIASALRKAKAQGLTIPVVYNTSAYEKVDTLKSLEDLVDIYLPDYKYHHSVFAKKYSQAADYPQVAFAAISEMIRQKGFLQMDSQGIVQKGVLLRHLVLPNGLSSSRAALQMLASEFGVLLPLSLMAQYYPAGNAGAYPELNRGISNAEYQKALDVILELGFVNVFTQELSCDDTWTPNFSSKGNDTIA